MGFQLLSAFQLMNSALNTLKGGLRSEKSINWSLESILNQITSNRIEYEKPIESQSLLSKQLLIPCFDCNCFLKTFDLFPIFS